MSDQPQPNVAQQITDIIAKAPDAVIAPEHESRLQKIEQVFKDWEPLLVKLADIAEKLA